MIAFIDDHREAHGVEPICRVLPIAPSTYHAHAAKRADPSLLSARARRDAELTRQIRTIHAASYKTYGAPRIHAEFKENGVAIGRKRIARLMRGAGLAGISCRRRPVTTKRTSVHHPPQISSAGISRQKGQMSCGSRILPSSPRSPASCSWRSCSTPGRAVLSAGHLLPTSRPALFSTRWTWPWHRESPTA